MYAQRNFYNTKCRVCDMCYCPGLQSEERLHQDYHKRVTHGIVYKGVRKKKSPMS